MFKLFNASFFVLNLVNCIGARIQQAWILFWICGLCAGLNLKMLIDDYQENKH